MAPTTQPIPCGLLALPDELLELILGNLGLHDLNSFCRTSWQCHHLTFARLYYLYQDEKNTSCLEWAAWRGRSETFARAIQTGVAACHFFHLIKACIYNDHPELVRILLTQQSVLDGWRDIKFQGRHRFHASVRVTPLSEACDSAEAPVSEELVDLLLATDHGRSDLALTSRGGDRPHIVPAICVAAKSNCERIVQKLLMLGASVNARDPYGDSPLMHALQTRNTPMINLLFDWGADANAYNRHGHGVLSQAAFLGQDFVDLVLRRGVPVTQLDTNGSSAIIEATRAGHDELVARLLDLGANPRTMNKHGSSALHIAVQFQLCSLATIRRLVQSGIEVDRRTGGGNTALQEAIKCLAPPSYIDFLLEAGADPALCHYDNLPTIYPPQVGFSTPSARNFEILKVFHKHGVDLNPPPSHGLSLLAWALCKNRIDIVEFILQNTHHTIEFRDAGDLYHTHGVDHFPLKYAQTTDFVDWLIEKGMDIHARTKDGTTMLHRLVGGHAQTCIIGFLIQKGADVNAVDHDGNTPLHHCSLARRYDSCAACLAKAGADLDMENHEDQTPFDLAQACDNQRVLIVLRRYMCKRSRIARKGLKQKMRRKEKDGKGREGRETDVWNDMETLSLLDRPHGGGARQTTSSRNVMFR